MNLEKAMMLSAKKHGYPDVIKQNVLQKVNTLPECKTCMKPVTTMGCFKCLWDEGG